jgi:hypothetical protein
MLLLVLTLVAINAVDAPVKPDTLAMLDPPPNPVADAENLYVLLAGLDAPLGTSVLDQGLRNLRDFEAALPEISAWENVGSEVGRTPEASRLEMAKEPNGSDLRVASVWEEVRAETVGSAPLPKEAIELLQRYKTLFTSPGYYETLPPHLAMPYYYPSAPLRRLFLKDVARRVQHGRDNERQAALTELIADMSMWQKMLQGEGLLVSKMLAVSYLHADLLLTADMVADRDISDALLAENPSLFAIGDASLWRIGSVFASELRAQESLLATLESSPDQFLYAAGGNPSWWQRQTGRLAHWFFLPNDTMNLAARAMRDMQEVVNGDPATMPMRIADLRDRFESEGPTDFPGILRNPIGKLLMAISTLSYSQYAVRVYDVAALQRAVRLAYELRVGGLQASDLPHFMQQHPEWSTHPLGAMPLLWDASVRRLFVPRQEVGTVERRFDIPVLVR